MRTIVLRLDYDDENQSSYERLVISLNDENTTFNTGDIVIDFIDMLHWISDTDFDMMLCSSSWDHFFMDGDDITTMYVDHSDEENPKVVLPSEIIDMDEVMEYPIHTFIKTMDDLKKYYHDNKQK